MPLFLYMKNNPQKEDLDIVKNEYQDREYTIKISVPEFNCVCPKTSLPDFATIHVEYIPDKYIVELKSLKLYMVKFRNMGIFHEHVTNYILDDFKEVCQPKQIKIIGDFKPRGGIKTIVTAEWKK